MEWLRLASSASVVRRAAAVAAVVGTILIAINHGDALLRGDLTVGRGLRIILTVMVPYCVSTFSSVAAMQEQRLATKRREQQARAVREREG
jgi:hypothetical protein